MHFFTGTYAFLVNLLNTPWICLSYIIHNCSISCVVNVTVCLWIMYCYASLLLCWPCIYSGWHILMFCLQIPYIVDTMLNSLRAENIHRWRIYALMINTYHTIASGNSPLARYVKVRVAHAPGLPGTFSPRVRDPDIHHGTCVTHVPWCMSGSLTSDFIRWRGKRSRHSRRMRNPQFYVSGKRLMAVMCRTPRQYYIYVAFSILGLSKSLQWVWYNQFQCAKGIAYIISMISANLIMVYFISGHCWNRHWA